MFQVYVPNVSSRFLGVCLQVFHLDVAYVFTHMKCFQVFFSSVSHICFECFSCFTLMLQVFYLDISKIDLVLQLVFQMHVSCVSSVFKCMLQVLHSDVLKVDRVLHLCLRFSTASPSPQCLLFLAPSPPPLFWCWHSHLLQLLAACMRVGSLRGASRDSPRAVGWVGRRGPRICWRGMQVRGGETEYVQARASVRALALVTIQRSFV
jgi:hypothetical protein